MFACKTTILTTEMRKSVHKLCCTCSYKYVLLIIAVFFDAGNGTHWDLIFKTTGCAFSPRNIGVAHKEHLVHQNAFFRTKTLKNME